LKKALGILTDVAGDLIVSIPKPWHFITTGLGVKIGFVIMILKQGKRDFNPTFIKSLAEKNSERHLSFY